MGVEIWWSIYSQNLDSVSCYDQFFTCVSCGTNHQGEPDMRISLLNVSVLAAIAAVTVLPLQSTFADADADRIARLEQRLLQLEQRLADTEQETKEVKVLASSAASGGSGASVLGNQATFDILSNSAWRNLRWTQEEQWAGIQRGMTEEQVIEALGPSPRSVKSMKPRVDKVLFYETSIRDRNNALRGKISLKDGKVVSFQKPLFGNTSQAN